MPKPDWYWLSIKYIKNKLFSKKKVHIFIVEYFYTFPNKSDMYVHHLVSGTTNNRKDTFVTFFPI